MLRCYTLHPPANLNKTKTCTAILVSIIFTFIGCIFWRKYLSDDIWTSLIFMYSPRYPLPVAIYYELSFVCSCFDGCGDRVKWSVAGQIIVGPVAKDFINTSDHPLGTLPEFCISHCCNNNIIAKRLLLQMWIGSTCKVFSIYRPVCVIHDASP